MIFIAESKTAPSSHHLFFRGCCSWVLGDINKEEDLKLDSKVVNMSKEGKKDPGGGGGGGGGGGSMKLKLVHSSPHLRQSAHLLTSSSAAAP